MQLFRLPALGVFSLLCSFSASATLGVFEHGSGIKSMGFGGVDYVGNEEATSLGANPSSLIQLGDRVDVGTDVITIRSRSYVTGNAAGPDDSFSSNGRHALPIPQAGFSKQFADHWAVGLAASAAGLNPDYERSPYARFAAPSQAAAAASAANSLKVIGISLGIAYEPISGQAFGVAFNAHHQALNLRGIAPFTAFSESPANVTDVGKHGAYAAGYTIGWTGQISPWVTGAVSYRSRTWAQRIEEYRGLLPDQGRLELPSIYGGALLFAPSEKWQIATQFQRYNYSSSHFFGNRVDKLFAGYPLGSSDGPGLGWKDQNAFKLGLRYQALPELTLRAGFLYATQLIPRSQTLLAPLAPGTSQIHYTAGLTYALNKASELSSYFAVAPNTKVRGSGSIPPVFGGGEVDTAFQGILFGLTYGWRFGRPN